MASQSIQALNDERGLMPTMYVNAISDLKQVLARLVTGNLMIVQGPTGIAPPSVAPPSVAPPQKPENGVDGEGTEDTDGATVQ